MQFLKKGVYQMSETNQIEIGTVTGRFQIKKADSEKRIAFGWAYESVQKDGRHVQDHSGDIVDISEIEDAAYNYVKLYRDGSEMHKRGGIGTVVESMVFTKEKMQALGIPEGTMPQGWWIGIQVSDDTVWERVKSGVYKMFSIEGTAKRVPYEPLQT